MAPTKNWYTSKTIWLMVGMIVLSGLSDPKIIAVIPAEFLPYITAIGSAIGIVLRLVTSQPIANSGTKPDEAPSIKE